MATANERVGAVYEVAIDGVGLMLCDNPSRPVRRQTAVLDTQPPGSDDPLSERIGRYDMIGQSDWTGGEGQEMADRTASDVTRYWHSEGLDPFSVPGQIACQRITTNLAATTYDRSGPETYYSPGLVGAGNVFYVQTGASQLTDQDGTAFSTGLAGNIGGMAFDGVYWYVTDGATVRRNNAAANPGANWSTTDVYELAWCGDRLMGHTAFDTPPELYSFAPGGTGTLIAGAHPASASLLGLGGGDGYVWYGANAGNTYHGTVYYWQVDSNPTNVGVAFALPQDESIRDIYYYLGNVFVTSGRVSYGGGAPFIDRTKIYRCVHSGDGTLVPQLIAETPGSNRSWVAGIGKHVAFSWVQMHGNGAGQSGIGILDLETGGYARWAVPTIVALTNGITQGVIPFDGGFAFRMNEPVTAGAGGVWWSPLPNSFAATGHDYTAGFLETSTSDLGTPALKHLDEIQVATLPLPASATVEVEYSTDGGSTYTSAATFTAAGETQHSVEFTTAIVAPHFRLRTTLTPTTDGSEAPVVTALIAKTHATGITDELIELPINCDDTIAGVTGATIAEDSGPGKGMARCRALQALIGRKVLFQDVDWKVTGTTSLAEVVGVESTSVQVFNQNRNHNDVTSHVAIVTLRQPYTAG